MPASVARFFHLEERGTNARTEIRAGVTTFLTMAYILFVNPMILSDPALGARAMPCSAAAAGTAIAAGVACILMGLISNFPLALASGMGLNAFLAFTVILAYGQTWQTAMGLVVLDGLIVLVLVLAGVRGWVFKAIPLDLKRAIGGGLGLLLATFGVVEAKLAVIPVSSAKLIASAPDPLAVAPPPLTGGPVHTWGVLLVTVGLIAMTVLHIRKVRGSILIGILAVTVLKVAGDLVTGAPDAAVHKLTLSPPDFSAIGAADVLGACKLALVPLLLSFIIVDFFDTLGTMTAIGERAGLAGTNGEIDGATRILATDAGAAVIGGLCGASSVTSYVESAAGVSEGGRTGLMPVVTGLLFLAALFVAPLFGLVPSEATAPALIFVGFLMLPGLRYIEWENARVAVPAFITIVTMPLTYSISHGIGFGFIAYVLVSVLAGKWREVHPLMYGAALVFAVSFAFLSP